MKSWAKNLVALVLGAQVKRLVAKSGVKVVAVAGSIGKTSTKLTTASILNAGFKVRYQTGNYNDPVSVPLVFFGLNMPRLFNPLAWLWVFIRNELTLLKHYPFDIVVIEIGTDGPGQIEQYFKRFVHPDITILTAITPEHMEYFADLDEVAHEELKVTDFSSEVVVNSDLVDEKYLKLIKRKHETYGVTNPAEYTLTNIKFSENEADFTLTHKGAKVFSSSHQQVAEPQLYSILAASAVALKLGMKPELINEAIHSIPSFSGRMQFLKGVNDSTIIDDTYNASPAAVKAALENLYRLESPKKIALLGNMNELGKYSAEEHTAIGNYCDPKKIDLVITLGPDSNKYLAPAAESKGCNVQKFEDPVSAGKYIATVLQPGAIILAKGSQNKVFAEEAVKQLLADPADVSKLVRQSDYWLKIKQRCFSGVKIS